MEYGVFAGDYRVFRDDVVFWVTFSSIALMIPVLFVGCPRIVSHLSLEGGGKGCQTTMQSALLWDVCKRSNIAGDKF